MTRVKDADRKEHNAERNLYTDVSNMDGYYNGAQQAGTRDDNL